MISDSSANWAEKTIQPSRISCGDSEIGCPATWLIGLRSMCHCVGTNGSNFTSGETVRVEHADYEHLVVTVP